MIHKEITNTAIPYKSYTDITSEEPNLVIGSQNILTTAQQVMERRPGFADPVESGVTTFSNLSQGFYYSRWDGSFYHIVNDIVGGQSKVYKLLITAGTSGLTPDASYVLIWTSASAEPFHFVISNNTLYFGNLTDMKKYTSGGSSGVSNWGIARYSLPFDGSQPGYQSISFTGTGISAYTGWYYRTTYYNSSTGHESSSSTLSTCTGIVSNKTVVLTLVASADPQVDKIRVYRTTDGGSTSPDQMLEITGSPFPNVSGNYNDTTPDASLGTRVCPFTTTNDPPPPLHNFCVYAGRIFGSTGATTWFSGAEEIGVGVKEECWPSGLTGNFYPWPQYVTSHRPMQDGVAIYTNGKIWKIAGDRRDNFIRGGLLDRRGATRHQNTFALGNSIGWIDTSSQVWLDGEEIGFDIRNDLKNIDQTQTYITPHVQGRFHWVCVLDGANGKLFIYDLDTQKWMAPWPLAFGSTASALASGEVSAGNVKLTIALNNKFSYAMNPTSYNDRGTAYSPVAVLNLLPVSTPHFAYNPPEHGEKVGVFDQAIVETDSHTPLDVAFLLDDDPTNVQSAFISIANNAHKPTRRSGVNEPLNLIKTLYGVDGSPAAERVSIKVTWETADKPFSCYTLAI